MSILFQPFNEMFSGNEIILHEFQCSSIHSKCPFYYSCPLMPMGLKECLIKSYQKLIINLSSIVVCLHIQFSRSEALEFEDIKININTGKYINSIFQPKV